MLRMRTLVVAMPLSLLFAGGPAEAISPQAITLPEAPTRCASAKDRASRAHAAINGLRAQYGLRALGANRALQDASAAHLDDLLSVRRLSHIGSDGTTFDRRVKRAGYRGHPSAENLAWNQPDAATVVRNWMASPSHRDAMLMRGVTALGVAYRCSPRFGHMWAMVVGRD